MRVIERVMFRERLSLFLKMKLSYFVSAGVGKGGVENWCFYLIVDFVMLVIFVEF